LLKGKSKEEVSDDMLKQSTGLGGDYFQCEGLYEPYRIKTVEGLYSEVDSKRKWTKKIGEGGRKEVMFLLSRRNRNYKGKLDIKGGKIGIWY